MKKEYARALPWVVVLAIFYFMGQHHYQMSQPVIVMVMAVVLPFLLIFGFWLLRD